MGTDLGLESPSYREHHPRTPVRGSPNCPRNPPLAPVKRGREVGGEGASHPEKLPFRRSKSHHAVLGLESPSYGIATSDSSCSCSCSNTENRTPKTENLSFLCVFLRGFAASREASRPPVSCGDLEAPQSQRAELGLESPSYGEDHPRTPVRGSPNCPRNPPLAPVKRGRGVGGEGASHPGKLPFRRSKSHHAVLGLESPSYGIATSDSSCSCSNTEHRPSRLRSFA